MAEEKKGGNKFMKYGLYAVGAAAIIAVTCISKISG